MAIAKTIRKEEESQITQLLYNLASLIIVSTFKVYYKRLMQSLNSFLEDLSSPNW